MIDVCGITCSAGVFDSRYASLARRTPAPRCINAYELAFFDADQEVVYVNDEPIPIGHDRVLCLRPGDVLRITLPYRAYYVRMTDVGGQLCGRMDHWGHGFALECSARMISLVNRLAEAEQEQNELEQLAALLTLISRLDAEYERSSLIESKVSKKSRESIRVGLAYIEQHFCEKCTLKEIATAAGRSPIYFHDVFREVMGMTPYDYIAQLRLKEAKRRLTMTQDDPSKIAESCGFCSQSYFNFVFKKSTGTTPLNYRRAQATRYLDTAGEKE